MATEIVMTDRNCNNVLPVLQLTTEIIISYYNFGRLLQFRLPHCIYINLLLGEAKTEVPRDVRNSKVRKQDTFRRDCSQH